MKSRLTNKTYLPLSSRLILAVTAAFYIVVEGQQRPVWVVIFDPNVIITIIFSIGIAFILIAIIHQGTKTLDHYHPWHRNFNQRLAFQLLCCALFPIALDLALVKYFFWLFRYDFSKSNYLTSEFPLVKLLIYGFNLWYYFVYSSNQPITNDSPELAPPDSPESESSESAAIQLPLLAFNGSMGINKRVFHVRDLNCYKRESNAGMALLKDNTIWFIDFKTDELEEKLNPQDFFKINRNVIIGFDTIETYKNDGKGGMLILKSGINFDGSVSVTRNRYPKFKVAFKEYIERQ